MERYIPVGKVHVRVTEEVYQAYYRPIWRTRYYAQRRGECACPGREYWRCDGICPGCRFCTAGPSLDMPMKGGLTLGEILPDESVNVEGEVIQARMLEALRREVARLDPESRRFCQLFACGCSERQGAAQMGMTRSTFKRRWEVIQIQLKKVLK